MPNCAARHELIARLNAALAGRGLAVREGDGGCMLVERNGYLRGIWQCQGNAFAWIPGGYNEPTEVVESHAEVVDVMLRKTG